MVEPMNDLARRLMVVNAVKLDAILALQRMAALYPPDGVTEHLMTTARVRIAAPLSAHDSDAELRC